MRPYLVLGVGVIATSFAAIFIRLTDAPALAIATGRLCLASALLLPAAAARSTPELRSLTGRHWLLALGSGFFLALHFALWIASLQHTTVASSLSLVTTSPMWVALAAHFFLRERLSSFAALGILGAFAGGLLIGGGDLSVGGTALYGDALALGGGVAVAAYFLIGRRLRATLTLVAYIALVYSIAAVCLLATVVAAGIPLTGYSLQTYAMIALLALFPQLIGHSSYNFALRYVSAAAVSVTTLGEPIGSTLLAALILKETPPLTTFAGGALVLAGIAAVILAERQRRPTGAGDAVNL